MFRKGYPFKWELHSAEFVYSMMMVSELNTFLYSTEKGGERAKQWRDRWRARERDWVLLQTGHSVGNRLDQWTNIYDSSRKDNPRSYEDEHYDYLQVLSFTWLERLASDKHVSLVSPFVSYEENEVFWIWLLEPNFTLVKRSSLQKERTNLRLAPGPVLYFLQWN